MDENGDQCCCVCAYFLGEVHEGGAAAQANLGGTVTVRYGDATNSRLTQLLFTTQS